jgi:hypothetical protein
MCSTLLPQDKSRGHRIMMGLASIILLGASSAFADTEFSYFEQGDLNYWKEPTPPKPSLTAKRSLPGTSVKPPGEAAASGSPKTFAWNKYLDVKNDEFFKEGDYTPPAPFMEIARNPTDENIENWFRYLETKNETLHRLQARLEDYAATHRGEVKFPPGAVRDPSVAAQIQAAAVSSEQVQRDLVRRLPRPQAPLPDARSFRLRMYFDAHCPHCKRMMGTLSTLSNLGFMIELRQVDADTKIRSEIPFPVVSATREELKKYQVEGVPLLLVGNLKKGTVSRVQGYQSAENVLKAIRE